MKIRKVIAFVLCLCTVLPFCGCGNKETACTCDCSYCCNEGSQDPGINIANPNLVGVWAIESTENLQNVVPDRVLAQSYPKGAEIEFTKDGKYIDSGRVIDCRIIDDATIEVFVDNTSITERIQYECSGDALKLYYQSKSYAVNLIRK